MNADPQSPRQANSAIHAVVLALAGLAFVYFGVFAAVFVDEVLMGTFWFSNHLPEEAESLFEFLYFPMLYLLRLL